MGHVPEAGLSGTAHPETVETRGSPAVSPRRETTAFTPTLTGSFDEVKLKVRLARQKREREDRVEKEKRETAARERAQKAEHEHRLALHRLELEFQLEKATCSTSGACLAR